MLVGDVLVPSPGYFRIGFDAANIRRLLQTNKKKTLSNIKSANFRAKWALFDIIGL